MVRADARRETSERRDSRGVSLLATGRVARRAAPTPYRRRRELRAAEPEWQRVCTRRR